jgi:hypothetical protein
MPDLVIIHFHEDRVIIKGDCFQAFDILRLRFKL